MNLTGDGHAVEMRAGQRCRQFVAARPLSLRAVKR
jgi:hypothetical protein